MTYQSTSIGTNIGANEQTTASIRAKGTGGVRARWGAAGSNIPYQQVSENYDLYVFNIPRDGNANITFEADANSEVEIEWVKLERGNKATDWTPSPEGLDTTTFKPLFDNKIKSALYWNRALTDEELLQIYNTQIKKNIIMKFSIATVEFWQSVGFDTTNWRKSIDGTKALVHDKFPQVL